MICWGKLQSRNRQGALTRCQKIEQRKRGLLRSPDYFIAPRTSHAYQGVPSERSLTGQKWPCCLPPASDPLPSVQLGCLVVLG